MLFVSPATRFEALDWKTTYCPDPEIEGHPLPRLPWLPSESRPHLLVVPVQRSRTNTSNLLFVSPRTRFEAPEKKATYLPFPEIDGNELPRLAWLTLELRLTRRVFPDSRSRTNTSALSFVSP